MISLDFTDLKGCCVNMIKWIVKPRRGDIFTCVHCGAVIRYVEFSEGVGVMRFCRRDTIHTIFNPPC